MASLPPALKFPTVEEEICEKWAKEDTFKTQNRLSEERGDEVGLLLGYTIFISISDFKYYIFHLITIRSFPSNRNIHFTTDLHLRQVYPIMATF